MQSSTPRLQSPGHARRFTTLLLAATLFLAPLQSWGADDDKSEKLHRVKHIVVIYQENWSFDSLYGDFPGANGLDNASSVSLNQIDRVTGASLSSLAGTPFNLATGSKPVLSTPPEPINNGAIDTRFPTTSLTGFNTLLPYIVDPYITNSDKTGDIVHRYWNEFSQIDGGKMDKFITWSDNPGLVMSYFNATNLPEGLLAQEFTMGDNFFHSAYGGSFLNHQFLISAQAPVFLKADKLTPSSLPTLATNGELALDPVTSKIVHDGKVTPKGAPIPGGGGTFDNFYAVNTIYSPNLVPTFKKTTDSDLLPSQNDSNPNDPVRPFIATIGDRLSEKGVSWKWYSGGFDAAIASTPTNPNAVTPATVDPLFQWHHQPFAYFDNYAPFLADGTRNPNSAAHLQDETIFFADVQNETLPAVSFIKPLGPNNEHPGYADLLTGQQHVATLVNTIRNSEYWGDTLIIITYDEHGGRWDHVAPPKVDQWGPGARVPAIFIGPMVKRHYVDHTAYETDSILSLIEKRFHLTPLSTHDALADPLSNIFKEDD